VRRILGGDGADHVVEVGGAQTLAQSLRAVRQGGVVSIIGVLSGVEANLPLTSILMQNIRLQGVLVGARDELEAMARAFAAAQVRPVIDRVFGFGEIRGALEAMAAGGHFGKIAIDFGR
jgi:NADPH:quinone reductase-like Zn-dependent oxidoreductase